MAEAKVTTGQMRAARALLGISQQEVAEKAGVSVPTIKRLEGGDGPVKGKYETVTAVIGVLEAAGVVFVTHGAAFGVMFDPDQSGSKP